MHISQFLARFGPSFATAMPEIAIERLHAGADDLGLMHAFRNAGGFFGAIVISLLTTKRLGMVYLIVLSAFGLALLMLGRVPTMRRRVYSVTFGKRLNNQ